MVGEEIQPEALRGGGFGGTWPGEGGAWGSLFPVASAGGDCAAGRWFGGMQTGRQLPLLYAARSIFCHAAGRGPAGVLLQKAKAVRCAARYAALARGPRGAAGTFLSRRIAAGKEKYPEKKPGTLIYSRGAASNWTKAAVRRPGSRLFFPHLKRRRERKAAQKKGLGSRRRGGIRRTGAAPRAPQSGAQGAAGSEAFEV